MTLREKQSVFALNFALLVIFAYDNDYEITYGEGQRTNDQQLLYFEGYTLMKIGSNIKLAKCGKRSKTMNSKHPLKLAHDIYLFKNGILLSKKEDFKIISEYWKSLNAKNVSGYDWGWDFGHFQMS